MSDEIQSESGNRRRLKVLISAYACDPGYGSEEGMGARWVTGIAAHHDIWLLTEKDRCATAMMAYLADRPELSERIRVLAVPRQRYGERISFFFMYYWTYMLWQKAAFRVAQELHGEIGFDLIHQLNMIGYREPGFLWRLNAPFVWGPIGGHAQMPWRFLKSLGRRGMVFYGIRNVLNWIQMRTSRRVRQAARRADVLITATAADQDAMARIHRRRSVLLNEQGALEPGAEVVKKSWDGIRPLRLVWAGLFFPRKALNLALEAVARVRGRVPVELHVLGTGESEAVWKASAVSLGIDSCCHWYGMVPHSDALRAIKDADVMLFTGLQEGTPSTVLEAIQGGVPVICHDACGFGAVINESCGIKIPMVSPERSVEGFAEALLSLHRNPSVLQRLSEGAIARAREQSWENKVNSMLDLYDQAIQSHKSRSDLE